MIGAVGDIDQGPHLSHFQVVNLDDHRLYFYSRKTTT
jgi:hypothetical protein